MLALKSLKQRKIVEILTLTESRVYWIEESANFGDYSGDFVLLSVDLLTSRAFERVARQWARSAIVQAPSAKCERASESSSFVPRPTTPDKKTMRTTLRNSILSEDREIRSKIWGLPDYPGQHWLFLRLLLETGTAILRVHPSHLKVQPLAMQREYLNFAVIVRPWVLVRPREFEPRPPAL